MISGEHLTEEMEEDPFRAPEMTEEKTQYILYTDCAEALEGEVKESLPKMEHGNQSQTTTKGKLSGGKGIKGGKARTLKEKTQVVVPQQGSRWACPSYGRCDWHVHGS